MTKLRTNCRTGRNASNRKCYFGTYREVSVSDIANKSHILSTACCRIPCDRIVTTVLDKDLAKTKVPNGVQPVFVSLALCGLFRPPML